MENIKLPQEWVDKGQEISASDLKCLSNIEMLSYEDGYETAAQAMLTAVEKMLITAISNWEEYQTRYGKKPNITSKIIELKNQLKELQSIQP